MEGQRQVPGKAIRIFVQLSLGGAGMGLAVGFAVTILLRTMFDNHDAEARFLPSRSRACPSDSSFTSRGPDMHYQLYAVAAVHCPGTLSRSRILVASM